MKKLAVIIIMLIFLVSGFGCNRNELANTAQNAQDVNTSEAGTILEEDYPVWEEQQLPMYEDYPVWEEHMLEDKNSSQE